MSISDQDQAVDSPIPVPEAGSKAASEAGSEDKPKAETEPQTEAEAASEDKPKAETATEAVAGRSRRRIRGRTRRPRTGS